jgi:hypothetical protein
MELSPGEINEHTKTSQEQKEVSVNSTSSSFSFISHLLVLLFLICTSLWGAW